MPFGLLSRVDPRNHVLDRRPDPAWEGAVLRGKGMPRHARRHSDVSCAKTAEQIEMPFGLWSQVGPVGSMYLVGVKITLRRGNFRGKEHARRYSAMSCAKMADAVWVVNLGVPKEACVTWGHIGATWRTRLSRPCAAAMRPTMSNYSDHSLFLLRSREALNRRR